MTHTIITTTSGPRSAEVLASVTVCLQGREFDLAVTRLDAERVTLTHVTSGLRMVALPPSARSWPDTARAAFDALIAKRGQIIVYQALCRAEE